jgi:hypothetical protein
MEWSENDSGAGLSPFVWTLFHGWSGPNELAHGVGVSSIPSVLIQPCWITRCELSQSQWFGAEPV